MPLNFIDVSRHNGKIDWKKVKASGVDGVIIRAGLGKSLAKVTQDSYEPNFEENYAGAKGAGLKVGVYWYSYATTVDEAKQEARACLKRIEGKQFEFPVYFDVEEQKQAALGKETLSAIVRTFCTDMENAGYFVGVYSSTAWATQYYDNTVTDRYALWIADWRSKLGYSGTVGAWQYSCSGKVDGISGNVDLSTFYTNYEPIIKERGKNGYGNTVDSSSGTATGLDSDASKRELNVTLWVDGKSYSGTLYRDTPDY